MRITFMAAIISACVTATAAAVQVPEPSKEDPRIRYVNYDPNNVVVLYTKVGASLLVQFDSNEQLVDLVGGDVEAWGVASPLARNGFFLKPAGNAPDSNIQAITTQRIYNFDVRLASKGAPSYLTVRFRYPATELAKAATLLESKRVRSLLDTGGGVVNRQYTVQGASDLSPIEAWDDGRSTFLRFRARSNIPAIYLSLDDEKDSEQIAKTSLTDDLVQIQGIRRKFILRIGTQVACVYNEGFRINDPRPPTNTASSSVVRNVKGGEK